MTPRPPVPDDRRCRSCGCTPNNCETCIAKTGEPCFWIERDLCSACAPADVVSKMRVIGVAGAAVDALSQLAQLLEPYAVPPAGELGAVAPNPIPIGGAAPLIITPDGRSAAAAGGLVDVAGRPLASAGGGRG